MAPCDRLALEHPTAPSLSPLEIVELADANGWAAATVLVAPFPVFPQTAAIDLVTDGAARRAARRACAEGGVTLALAYPFVLSRRADAASLAPSLEAAAEIGAQGAGLLVYERDAGRAAQEVEAFCALASGLGLRPVLEFFGGSAVPTVQAADALGAQASPLGLCVDLLHLVRSGGAVADLAGIRTPLVHAQLSDAPRLPMQPRDAEAACGRLTPGDGELDIAGFVAVLPADAWLGVETPPTAMSREDETARAIAVMRKTRALLAGLPQVSSASSG